MDIMLVATCERCRGWYNMDYEEGLDSVHWDMRTGELCPNNNDQYWRIIEVPYRPDWETAN